MISYIHQYNFLFSKSHFTFTELLVLPTLNFLQFRLLCLHFGSILIDTTEQNITEKATNNLYVL